MQIRTILYQCIKTLIKHVFLLNFTYELLFTHSVYVDDCFLLFRSLDHVPLFLDYLNRQHANIAFTAEIERDGKLPFLDIDISRSESKFATPV